MTETRQQVRREGIQLEKQMRARAANDNRKARQAALPRKTEGSEAYWNAVKSAVSRLRRPKGGRVDSRTVRKGRPFGRIKRMRFGDYHYTKGFRARAS